MIMPCRSCKCRDCVEHAELNVQEVVVPRGSKELLSAETKAMIKGLLPGARISLQPSSRWSVAALRKLDVASLFGSAGVPAVLQRHLNVDGEQSAALTAFAGMLAFLQTSLLDQAVLAVHCVEDLYPAGAAVASAVDEDGDTSMATAAAEEESGHLVLDGAALTNLEVRFCVILLPACLPLQFLAKDRRVPQSPNEMKCLKGLHRFGGACRCCKQVMGAPRARFWRSWITATRRGGGGC